MGSKIVNFRGGTSHEFLRGVPVENFLRGNENAKISEGGSHCETSSTGISQGVEGNCKFPRGCFEKYRISEGFSLKTVS